ncbi:transmembrane protein 53 isoform X2 [Anabrus simplex]
MLLFPRSAVMTASVRRFNFQKVSKNMELIRASTPLEGQAMKAGAEVVGEAAVGAIRPLVVMLPWLLAKRHHVLKYARLYTDRGLDVLAVRSHPGHLLRPAKGSQLVATELLGYLKNLPGQAPLMLHGFSVGGYLWGEALVQLAKDPSLLSVLSRRVVGQVWDSAVELSEAPAGLARSVFPRSQMLQGFVQKFISTYLSAFREQATRHYELSSQYFHGKPLLSPALLLLSRSDPIGTVSANERLIENWKKAGVPTQVKIWDGSPHVGHFRMYRSEYEEQVVMFLKRLGLGNA